MRVSYWMGMSLTFRSKAPVKSIPISTFVEPVLSNTTAVRKVATNRKGYFLISANYNDNILEFHEQNMESLEQSKYFNQNYMINN